MEIHISHSREETEKLGKKLAKSLPKGSVIAYLGGLGVGKTAFTSGVAKGLGIDCDVFSPTFAICNTYAGGENTLYHYDMYRIDSWDSLYSTGFFDFLETDAYIAVEWSENIYAAIPEDAVIVEFERLGENERKIKIYKKTEETK